MTKYFVTVHQTNGSCYVAVDVVEHFIGDTLRLYKLNTEGTTYLSNVFPWCTVLSMGMEPQLDG
jgi:hypothetical protein